MHWAGDMNHRPKSKDVGFIPVELEIHLVDKGEAGRAPVEFLTLSLLPLILQHHSFAFLLSFSLCLLLLP